MGLATLLFVAVAAAVLWYVAAPLLRKDAAESERRFKALLALHDLAPGEADSEHGED